MTSKKSFPLLPKQKLSRRIIFRLSEKDYNDLNNLCKKNNVTLSDLLRHFIYQFLFKKGK